MESVMPLLSSISEQSLASKSMITTRNQNGAVIWQYCWKKAADEFAMAGWSIIMVVL